MNEVKFNSKVCTSVEQSKRLLELGLKLETADMSLTVICGSEIAQWAGEVNNLGNIKINGTDVPNEEIKNIPAWSIHRLIELLPQYIHLDDYADTHYYLTINPFKVIYVNSHLLWIYQRDKGCLYDKLIDTIEWTIKNNFFNKEYLKP